MAKTKDGNTRGKKYSDVATAMTAPSDNNNDSGGGGGGGEKKEKKTLPGLDEIDTLFATKRERAKTTQERARMEEEEIRLERKRRKRAKAEEEAEEYALRGVVVGGGTASSALAAAGGSGGGGGGGGRAGDAVAPAHLHDRATKMKSLTYTREDVERLNKKKTEDDDDDGGKTRGGEGGDGNNGRWACDGLGGVFNGEGYTGRRDGGGHRVFKAHLMNRKGFGNSPDCPFDCDCCFI